MALASRAKASVRSKSPVEIVGDRAHLATVPDQHDARLEVALGGAFEGEAHGAQRLPALAQPQAGERQDAGNHRGRGGGTVVAPSEASHGEAEAAGRGAAHDPVSLRERDEFIIGDTGVVEDSVEMRHRACFTARQARLEAQSSICVQFADRSGRRFRSRRDRERADWNDS